VMPRSESVVASDAFPGRQLLPLRGLVISNAETRNPRVIRGFFGAAHLGFDLPEQLTGLALGALVIPRSRSAAGSRGLPSPPASSASRCAIKRNFTSAGLSR
jgi:hypothetical protein